MSALWDDPVSWRDAMIPPVTFDQALRAARKAKVVSFVWRGITFNLSEQGTTATGTTPTLIDAWKAKKRARSA